MQHNKLSEIPAGAILCLTFLNALAPKQQPWHHSSHHFCIYNMLETSSESVESCLEGIQRLKKLRRLNLVANKSLGCMIFWI